MFCTDGCDVKLENTKSYHGAEGTKGIQLDLHSVTPGIAQGKKVAWCPRLLWSRLIFFVSLFFGRRKVLFLFGVYKKLDILVCIFEHIFHYTLKQ